MQTLADPKLQVPHASWMGFKDGAKWPWVIYIVQIYLEPQNLLLAAIIPPLPSPGMDLTALRKLALPHQLSIGIWGATNSQKLQMVGFKEIKEN